VLWIADTETRRFEYLSPAHDRIWGVPPGSVKELGDWVETIHLDDRAGALAALERVERGEVVVQEYRILRPNGTVRWIRDTGFPIAHEQGRAVRIGGVSQDITKHESSFVYMIGPDDAARRQLTLLLQEGGCDCRPFATATAFLDVAPALLPGCVVLDIRTAGANGLTMLTELKARRIPLPVIVIGASGEVETAVRAMKAGAVEFLQAPHAMSALRTAVASALANLRDAGERDEIVEVARIRIAEMTTRERQVLEGLLDGATNKMIARRLDLSPRTVEVHRAHLMERLGTRTLPELVLLAAAAGLRPPRAETPPADR
jgi:PAS domain S-box-containing protein